MRMGVDVPYPTTVVKDGTSNPSYNYRNVGVAIDCSARSDQDGLFAVTVTVSDSSIFMAPAAGAVTPSNSMATFVSGAPVFRNFSVNSILLLKDGQTSQLTTSADPTTGDVMRVDVTLTLVKGTAQAAVPDTVVYVSGAVNNPGAYRYERYMTVDAAITMAGGLTRQASPFIVIKRRVDGKEVRLDTTPMTVLQPGDTVQPQLKR
jgi:hypothetical protein